MFIRSVAGLITAMIFAAACLMAAGDDSQKPLLTEDLRPFGFRDFHKNRNVSDYTEIQFLSDDLLLVSINERVFAKSEEPLFSDQGAADLLLFNLHDGKLIKNTHYPIEKTDNAVQATENDHFVVLNQEGVHLCSPDLSCGPPFATKGPVIVVADGKELIVGGNARTEKLLLDSATLQIIKTPSPEELKTLAIGRAYTGALFVIPSLVGTLPKASANTVIMCRLNQGALATRENGEAVDIAIRNLDGTALYQVPVTRAYQAAILPDLAGKRFSVEDQGYTRMNSIANFMDIDQGRPYNFSRVRVFDTDLGKQLFELHWDPRPSSFAPVAAFSPDGHKLALIRHSELEVFEIP